MTTPRCDKFDQQPQPIQITPTPARPPRRRMTQTTDNEHRCTPRPKEQDVNTFYGAKKETRLDLGCSLSNSTSHKRFPQTNEKLDTNRGGKGAIQERRDTRNQRKQRITDDSLITRGNEAGRTQVTGGGLDKESTRDHRNLIPQAN